MVRHEHIGMYGASEPVGEFLEVVQVVLVVGFGMKADRAVIAALDDVPGNAGERQAGAAGHGGTS